MVASNIVRSSFVVVLLLLLAFLASADAPSISSIVPATASQVAVNSTIEISADVTDGIGVDVVTVNVTIPNGTIHAFNLSSVGGDKYNSTYGVPTMEGIYTLFIAANDSTGDVGTSQTTFEAIFNDPTDIDGLRLWLDASDNSTLYTDASCSTAVTAEDQEIYCWEDKSTYRANATNVSGKGRPIFTGNGFNGLSVVQFNKSQSDTLRHELSSQYTSDFTIFVVIQSLGNAALYDSFFSNGEPAHVDHFQIDYTDSGNAFRYGASTKFNFETYSTEMRLYSVTHDGSDVVLYNDGQQVNSGSTTEGRVFEHYRVNQNRAGNQHHHSLIGEVILYDWDMNACERESVNVYLGNKYGRDFFGLASRYDNVFPHNVSINGIGILDSVCSGNRTFSSASSSIVTINNASSLDVINESLTFAHDNLSLGLNNSDSVSGFFYRLNRSWQVDHDFAFGDGVGVVNVSFDLGGLGYEVSDPGRFTLLRDTTNAEFFDAVMHDTGKEVIGSVVRFTDVDFTTGEYFTLALRNLVGPNVTTLVPSGEQYDPFDTVDFGAEITSLTTIVDTTYLNITYPNGTIDQLDLDFDTGTNYTNKSFFTVPDLHGTYTVRFFANDSDGAVNSTETTTFEVSSSLPPTLQFTVPPSPPNASTQKSPLVMNLTSDSQNVEHYSFIDVDNSLLLWFRMDNNSGGSTLDGQSSYGHSGTLSGGSIDTFTTRFGDSLSLTGSDYAEVTLSDQTLNMTGNAITMAIWFRPSGNSGIQILFGHPRFTSHTSPWWNYVLELVNDQVFSRMGSASVVSDTGRVQTDVWQHLAVTYNGTDMGLYYDGELINTSSKTANLTGGDSMSLYVGVNVEFNEYFTGNLDELLLFNRSLTREEIRSLYNTSKYAYETQLSLSDGQHTFEAWAVSENGNQLDNRTWEVTIDSTPPSVIDVLPATGNYTFGEVLTLSTNVTDSITVQNVSVNVTYPNGTIELIPLPNAGGDVFSTSFTVPQSAGTYTALFYANDTAGNVNNSESVSFEGINNATPSILFVTPTPANATNSTQNSLHVNVSSDDFGMDHHYVFTELDSSLVMWMRFDDVDGSGHPQDLSGKDFDGTLTSGALINGTGVFGDAAHFDGTDDYIDLPDMDVDFSSGLSACVWMYWNAHSESWSRIFDFGQGQADDNILFAHEGITSNLVYEVYVGGTGGGQVKASSALSTGAWQHLCVSADDSGNARLYVDGINVQNGTTGVPAVLTRQNAYLGRSNWGVDGYLNGAMDEFLLFNRSLADEEIFSLYNATATQYNHTFTSLAEGDHQYQSFAVSANSNTNQTENRTFSVDTTAPAVIGVLPTGDVNTSVVVEVAANASDARGISLVYANMTLPNGTIEHFNLTLAAGEKYNASYTLPALAGSYTLRVFANDTLGNENSSETSSLTASLYIVPSLHFIDDTPANQSVVGKSNLSINISSASASSEHYTFVERNDDLILWMRFDEVNTSGDPLDISGNANNGSLFNGALINTTGLYGDALQLDGNNDHVEVPSSPTLELGAGEFTVAMWFYARADTAGTQQLMSKRWQTGENYEIQILNTGIIRAYAGESGSATFIDSTFNVDSNLNAWHHVTFTRGNGTMKLYIDGVQEAQAASTHDVSSSAILYIGRDGNGSSEYFTGAIDEFLIINRSLDVPEIASLMNASTQHSYTYTGLEDGNYTFVGRSANDLSFTNQTLERILVVDTTPPNVNTLQTDPSTTFVLTKDINVTVNTTDLNGIGNVSVNVTLPNGTIEQKTLNLSHGDVYNVSFTVPEMKGIYTVLAIGRDTAGNENTSETTTFDVQNSAPSTSALQFNAGSDLTLTAAVTTTFKGSATITDANGYGDVDNVTGYLFYTDEGVAASDNERIHYTASCTDDGDGSGTTVTYNCTFNVAHFAQPSDAGSNGSASNWTFLMLPKDQNNTGDNGTTVLDVLSLAAFNITPSSINFGNLDIGEDTASTNQLINMTNRGNIGMDVQLSGTNMSCDSGVVNVTFLEYESTTFTYGAGNDLSDASAEVDLDVGVGTEASRTLSKNTYYGLGIPDIGVGGTCSGTITLTGVSDPLND